MSADYRVDGPTCYRCGGPWFEPDGHGILRCCDCDARWLPTAIVKRRQANPSNPAYERWVIDCPWCGGEHTHGGSPGRRAPHCGDRGRPNPGYVIRLPEAKP